MQKTKKYNIGLDLGVGSVGWCVTDENNNILKRNGKNMWGSRLFSEASTAAERRSFRASRRRLNRRKERINILQSLLIDDIEKEYPNFIQMLRETSLIKEDKNESMKILNKKHNLFSEDGNTDINYYAKFPTIYHLRNYLLNEKEKVDIRLIYLAIHHIIKYRGNFLYEGDFSVDSDLIKESIENIIKYLENSYDIQLKNSIDSLITILSDKSLRKADKKDSLISEFDYDKEDKKVVTNIINAILGYKFEINAIFDSSVELKLSFSNEIDNEEEILNELGEFEFIYDSLKNIYSWHILQNMLNNEKYISGAFIKKYQKYNKDLNLLKLVYKKYLPELYNQMFREKRTNNYVAYNGKNNSDTIKKCKMEDLYTTIKNDLKNLDDNIVEKVIILTEIENNDFLRKINSVENGAIPYQLHKVELEQILKNQSKYYKTIDENKEKILSLLTFRIPYYVGPLAKNNQISKWSWIVRKSNEKILPWTFDKVVDIDETAEKFIKRMTNKCTYLINEDVMPKQSILYSKFCVYNELNNIKINNKLLAKDMKDKIYKELFLKKKKVTTDHVIKLYNQCGFEVESITGCSDGKNFNSSMSSYIDLEKVFGNINESNLEQCEKLIYWITIFEDKSILKRKIKNEFKNIDDNQLKKILKLKYTGWSRLSKKLIRGLKSIDNNESIMEKLENTKFNFMQIINKKEFGFDKQIESYMPKENRKITYKDIEELQTSPANKRAIWQAVLIVNEIVKIQECEPSNIYIEFARNDEINPKMKSKRAKAILQKYDEIENFKFENKNIYTELKKHQTDKEFSDRLYLYFSQMGKCLYSGRPLNIEEISTYQIDHIIPQSYIKDDSIDNRALVIADENQRKSDSLLLDSSIQKNMRAWWEYLLSNNLISQNKFYKLTRSKMFETNDDKVKFVERQLVETRQITKHVTNILNNQYKNSKIFALRSELTGYFRNKYKIFKNRNVNSCHHAQDAYIMSIIGNIINKQWRNLDEFQYGKYVSNYIKSKEFSNEKNSIIIGMISKNLDIKNVKKCMNYKDYFISRMLEEQTGAFYNQTLYSPKDKPVISLKENLNSNVYGGYSGENKGYCCIYKFIDKRGKELYKLTGIPIKVAADIKNKKVSLEDYIQSTLEENKLVKVIRNKVLKNQEYLDENGTLMMFRSDSEIKCAKQLILSTELNELIHYINNGQVEKIESKYSDVYEYVFDSLLEKLKSEYPCFANRYIEIKDKKNVFIDLDTDKKKNVLNQILELMSNSNANLKLIGLSDRAGRMSKQKFEDKRLRAMTFVDKSVTGMYERRFHVWDGEQ